MAKPATARPLVERPYAVWESTDSEFLHWAIDLYLRRDAADAPILDATYGRGIFWRSPADRFSRHVTAIDIKPKLPGVIAMDNRKLELSDATFLVVIYDPTHITDAGKSAYQ